MGFNCRPEFQVLQKSLYIHTPTRSNGIQPWALFQFRSWNQHVALFVMDHEVMEYSLLWFTFIELMVVVVILGILAMVVMPNLIGEDDKARWNKARTDITAIESALKMYRLDNGTYPTTEQGLEALIRAPETEPVPKRYKKGGYLDKRQVPKDPWGNEFIYMSPGTHGDFDLFSYGADGVSGGEDWDRDVTNWEFE